MKKPSQELVDAFFSWYKNDHHSQGEDYYKDTITQSNLSGLNREQFADFFNQFAHKGGLVQSQGYRNAPKLRKAIDIDYASFRSFVMEPFEDGFDEFQWLSRIDNFNGFGQGIATIYLNRIDKSRFAILNNKSAKGMDLFGLKLPTALTKRYQAVRDAQRELIDWYPAFDNFFRTDSLMHFLIGEENGQSWARELAGTEAKIHQEREFGTQTQDRTKHEVPDDGDLQYWWLNANPKIWDIVESTIGTRQTYTSHNAQGNKRRIYQYFKQVRPEDILFGYVASPLRQIVALCKVTKGLHETEEGEVFEFEKVEQFAQPVSFRELQAVPELKKCEPLINNQGSLFKVSPEEYEIIRNIIDEANEIVTGKGRIAPLYSLEECSAATGFVRAKLAYWITAIERKKQVILFGPPGTGKTFLADHLARHIVGGTDGLLDCIQFHPAYSYEEFIQGIRPESDEKGNLQFELKPGRFLEFCAQARLRKGPCVLIIDEINRANLARVFGELMYLLEYRDKGIPLAGGMRFSIPENVRIIGTMNTADRSIALVDFALRRRFAFLELSPEYDVLLAYQRSHTFNAEGLIRVLRDINATINDKNYHLGISFFLTDKIKEKLEEIWKMEIEPYLEEYFFSQPEAVAKYRWDKAKDLILS